MTPRRPSTACANAWRRSQIDNTDIVTVIALTVALVVAAVARIDAIVNSEAIERMAGKQLRKSLDAIRVECEVE